MTAPRQGVVLGQVSAEPLWIEITLGGVPVTLLAQPFNVVRDEEARQRLAREAQSAGSVSALLEMLSPTAAQALRSIDEVTLQSALDVWLAIQIGRVVVEDWEGVLDPDGHPLPYTADHFDLACMTIPGFAEGFYSAWARPRIMLEAAGNA